MNIIDAIKSGRPFRRKSWVTFWVVNCGTVNDDPFQGIAFWDEKGQRVAVTRNDLLADDWEIQEKTVTITRAQLFAAMEQVHWSFVQHFVRKTYMPAVWCEQDLARKLGLGDDK